MEQREYLKNVELARVLDKRAERKRLTEGKAKEDGGPIAAKPIQPPPKEKKRERDGTGQDRAAKKKLRREKPTPVGNTNARQDLSRVLGNIF